MTTTVLQSFGDRIVAAAAMALGCVSNAAFAQSIETLVEIRHVPEVAVLSTVTAGSQIHEYARVVHFEATVPDTQMRGGQWLIPLTVEAGTQMFPVETRTKFKACVPSGPCGLDDDGDGTFDRMAQDEVATALKLKVKVPYRSVRFVSQSPENLRQIILYLGATKDSLRLSYREFSNDLARPAFTEEIAIPLQEKFPQDVAVKQIRMRIHSITGLGMSYEILP